MRTDRPSTWQIGIRQLFTGTPSSEHRARAALALAAAFLRAREAQVLTKHVDEPPERRAAVALPRAVDVNSRTREDCGTDTSPAESAASGTSRPVAWKIAAATAGAGTSIGSSPTPLAPHGPREYGRSTSMTSIGGTSSEVGMM